MQKLGLLVKLEAKLGKEKEVVDLLKTGLALAKNEPDTTTWYGIQIGPSTFGIFDTFSDELGRKAHLSGKIAAALIEKSSDLFSKDPVIEFVDVLAMK